MIIDFNIPDVQWLWTPLIASALATGLIRFFLGPVRGALLAGMGIGVGYLVAHLLMQGVPGWPPTSALDTIPYILAGGMLVGALLDELDNPEGILRPLYIGLPIVIVFWLGVTFFGGFRDLSSTAPYAVIMVAGIIAMQRLQDDRDEETASPVALMMAIAGLAVAGIVVDGPLWQYAIALAAATLGYLVWNWPRARYPWSTTATLSIGGAYVSLAAITVLNNSILALPVAASFLAFYVAPMVERLFYPRQSVQPFLQAFISLGPIVVAGFSAHWLT